MKTSKDNQGPEEIELLRGGSVVSTLVGAFGGAIRETRLTALLGYLIALEPTPFLEPFGFCGKVRNVSVEHRHGNDRSDILVETTQGLGVIEAKVGAIDPFEQSKKYGAKWTVLLTQYLPSVQRRKLKGSKYVRWQQLTALLLRMSRSPNQKVSFVSRDLLTYLEEHRMVKQRESIEIYAREINESLTLNLFLKARMYGCNYEPSSSLAEALYFAPHFGQTIAQNYGGVRVGISYIAKIEGVEVVETWEDFFNAVKSIRGKPWWNSHQKEIEPLHAAPNWAWSGGKKNSFLFLAKPRLVFNPPINKNNLQKGKGWLSKRTFSYDQFFQAWGC